MCVKKTKWKYIQFRPIHQFNYKIIIKSLKLSYFPIKVAFYFIFLTQQNVFYIYLIFKLFSGVCHFREKTVHYPPKKPIRSPTLYQNFREKY